MLQSFDRPTAVLPLLQYLQIVYNWIEVGPTYWSPQDYGAHNSTLSSEAWSLALKVECQRNHEDSQELPDEDPHIVNRGIEESLRVLAVGGHLKGSMLVTSLRI